jgi:anaerobic magnesium-protoporphyrin IX monomethyl ester cyclase
MKKILLICPSGVMGAFSNSKLNVAVPKIPYLSLAMIASPLLAKGHEVQLLDLSLCLDPKKSLASKLKKFNPNFVGITFTTTLFNEASEISAIIKSCNKNITIIGGGAHASSLPEETLKHSDIDIIVIGEGESTFLDIISQKKLEQIEGIAFKKAGAITRNKNRKLLENLDDLPFPAWEIFDIKKYHSPRLTAKKSPVGPLETSRGCVAGCTYCNKSVFERRFRAKSKDRVIKDIEHNLKHGFKEIHIYDDCFSTNITRAKDICDEIIKRKLKFSWNLSNGIRVDTIDEDLFRKMKKAGCYRVSFGVESGSQQILNNIKKGTNLSQLRTAFKLARKTGIETIGFFMIGLPGDTKETIKQTISFAKELKPDIPKIGITIPFPGTQLYHEWDKQGIIKSKDWRKYNYHNPSKIYDHPNLDWNTIHEYYNKFYRELYLNPSFILRRFVRDIKKGELFYDIFYFLKTLKYGW